MIGAYPRVLLAGLVLGVALDIAHAQQEPLRALIGTWQGRADVRQDPERTLVIKSVVQKGTQWVADIHYGTTGKGLSHLRGRVEVAAGTTILTFTTAADNVAELKLVAGRQLLGTLRVRSSAIDRVDRELRLEKVSD
jgi:hypothetical protein